MSSTVTVAPTLREKGWMITVAGQSTFDGGKNPESLKKKARATYCFQKGKLTLENMLVDL